VNNVIKINPKPYKWLLANRDKRYLYLHGGASSGKSHTMGQYLLKDKFTMERNIGILSLRKVQPAVRTSCLAVARHYIRKAGLEKSIRINLSTMTMTAWNGNRWLFDGLDNVFKKRSMEGINYVHIEETAGKHHDAQFTEREIKQLDMTCRAENENGINQFFFTYNPFDPMGNKWLKDREDKVDADPRSAQMLLNYLDNPFLAPEEIAVIEALMDDPEYDKIYRLGMWATPEALIYSNWDIVNEMPEEYEERIWGLDFGYAHPTALVELRITEKEVWENEAIFKTHLTTPELIDLMKVIIENPFDEIVADSSRPEAIAEIKRAGFNIYPCLKGPKSVWYGIRDVQKYKCHILHSATNIIDEKSGYKWKVDTAENVLDEPVKIRDHTLDAERYALSRVAARTKVAVSIIDLGDDEIDDDEGWI